VRIVGVAVSAIAYSDWSDRSNLRPSGTLAACRCSEWRVFEENAVVLLTTHTALTSPTKRCPVERLPVVYDIQAIGPSSLVGDQVYLL